MSPLVYNHIGICTNRYYQFYLEVLNEFLLQFFSFSNTEGFSLTDLGDFISTGFSVFISLVISYLISEELLASDKDFEQFFYVTAY